jgi:hypothetical protein
MSNEAEYQLVERYRLCEGRCQTPHQQIFCGSPSAREKLMQYEKGRT